jgi:hypothetical protein
MSEARAMTSRERLEAVFAGRQPDRTPALGGWILCPEHICALAGASSPADYWADPVGLSLRAYEALHVDGLIACAVSLSPENYRTIGAHNYVHARPDLSLQEALDRIDALPSAEETLSGFDIEEEYCAYRQQLLEMQARCGGMVWMPANWSAGAVIEWYMDFGYENFFEIVGGHPKQAQKLMEIGGAQGYCQSSLVARAVSEGLYPHAVHLGEDICSQRGPMVSPRFMERYYAPALRFGLQPLLDVGCHPVWHCDGDVRPILDMLIDCGIQGFQGFQSECGVTLELVIEKRTREGQPLIIFGPLSVTTDLLIYTPEQVRARVHQAIERCRGEANLVLFTSSSINPDVPLANVRALYEAVREA